MAVGALIGCKEMFLPKPEEPEGRQHPELLQLSVLPAGVLRGRRGQAQQWWGHPCPQGTSTLPWRTNPKLAQITMFPATRTHRSRPITQTHGEDTVRAPGMAPERTTL